MSFPLLRLPSVAVRCVLKQVDQKDAMKIGLCSKRAKNLVKYERRVPSEKPRLLMGIGTFYHVTVLYKITISVEDLSKIPENIDHWTIDGEKVPVFKQNERVFEMYFENRLSGTQKLISYLTDILNIPIYELSIMLTQVQEVDPRIAIDWVMSRQESVQSIELTADLATGVKDDIQYALNKCRAAKRMEFFVYGRHYGLSKLPTQHKLGDGELVKWLTADDLIRCDCPKIILYNTKLGEMQVNQFLKNWMNGGNPKLAHLEVCLEKLDIEMITSGLSATKVTREEPVRLVLGPDQSYKIRDSWDITRNDGRKMSIVNSRPLSSISHFYVWPEHE